MNIHTAETEIHLPDINSFEPVYSYQELVDKVDELEKQVRHLKSQPRYQIFPLNAQPKYNNWVEAAIHKTLDFLRW